jgi:hypothetical protein
MHQSQKLQCLNASGAPLVPGEHTCCALLNKRVLYIGSAPVGWDIVCVTLDQQTIAKLFCTLYTLHATVRTVAALGSAPASALTGRGFVLVLYGPPGVRPRFPAQAGAEACLLALSRSSLSLQHEAIIGVVSFLALIAS